MKSKTGANRPRKKRITKRERAVAEANRLSLLLASAPPETGQPFAPPAFIVDPILAPALVVWRELAPRLVEREVLSQDDRFMFAALCYWHAEFIAAVDDIGKRGYSFMVKATAGGTRPWENPSVGRRDIAFDYIVDLSRKFGLTPLDRNIFYRAQKGADLPLFPGDEERKSSESTADAHAVTAAEWGTLLNPEERPN